MACSACGLGDSGMLSFMALVQDDRALNRKQDKQKYAGKAFCAMTPEQIKEQCSAPKPKKAKETPPTGTGDDDASVVTTSTFGSKLKGIFSKGS